MVSPNTIEGRIDFVRRVAMAINARRRGEYESLPVPSGWILVLTLSLGLLAAVIAIAILVEVAR